MDGIDTTTPGPEKTDPILLVADQGFRASIALDDWLQVGARVVVNRLPRQGPWPGTVVGLRQARYSVAEWFLASGDRREARFFSHPEDDYAVGRTFPITMGRNTWQAKVVEESPATRVTVSFVIQSGATRRRDFFRLGVLSVFAEPSDDGGMTFHALAPPASPVSTPRQDGTAR